MAQEPITLFARIADPAGVARRLRQLAPTVAIDGSDDNWRNAVVTFGKWWKKRRLTLTHDPAYYSEPNWSVQMSGMRGYFSRFPHTDRKDLALSLTTTFRFSLGTLFDPDFDPKGDPRLDVLYAVAQFLDGVLFAPSSLRDARGRILFAAGGGDEEDAGATWPKVIGEVSVTDPPDAPAQDESRPKPADEENTDAEPPTAERVARRTLALTALTTRAVLEQEPSRRNAPARHKELLAWVRDIGIAGEIEPDEWKVLQRPLGRLDARMQINSTWRLEGLAVLAWALGQFDIPSHDQLVKMNSLWTSLGELDAGAARSLLAAPALRPRDEIGALRQRLFAIHWRLRNYHLRPVVMDFAEYARTCWFGPLELSGVPLVKGDLALRGKRIDRASADVFGSAHSAAQERHQAANWLWEGPERYSEASVAT